MGIDISGGMFVGNEVSDELVEQYEDLYDFCDEHDMVLFRPYYDAEQEECHIGFSIADIKVDDINQDWLKSIKDKGVKFKELTGLEPILIGMQDVF